MGEVRTEITLVNIGDKNIADRGYMPRDQVRKLTVNAVVDTGAWTLVINAVVLTATRRVMWLSSGCHVPCIKLNLTHKNKGC